jgi:tripartite-type tricarboxylate transporter receptor subunit TctC
VPLSPGGFADTPARILAAVRQMGKQLFVENRPGAGGTCGWDRGEQPPDGYTLANGRNAPHQLAPLQEPSTTLSGTSRISMMASGPKLSSSTRKAVINVRELIAAAKAKPGVITPPRARERQLSTPVAALFKRHGGRAAQPRAVQGRGPRCSDLLGGEGVSFAGRTSSATCAADASRRSR